MSYNCETKDFRAQEIVSLIDKKRIILNPAYQRNYRWDSKRASLYIESLIKGIRSPEIQTCRIDNQKYNVLDGQQRLTTITKYMHGDFPLSKGIDIPKELRGKYYGELDELYQNKLDDATIHANVYSDLTRTEEYDIFCRINKGSLSMTNQELRHAFYQCALVNKLDSLVDLAEFKEYLHFTDAAAAKMEPQEIALLVFAEHYRDIETKSLAATARKTSLDAFLANKGTRFSDAEVEESINWFKSVFKLIYSIFGEIMNPFLVRTASEANHKINADSSMLCIFIRSLDEYGLTVFRKNADEIRTLWGKFLKQCAQEPSVHVHQQGYLYYKKWCTHLETVPDINIKCTQSKRCFPREIREDLFKQDPTCKLCGQKITTIEDSQVDHIIPFSKGGSTTIENAQLVHTWCNQSKGSKSDV